MTHRRGVYALLLAAAHASECGCASSSRAGVVAPFGDADAGSCTTPAGDSPSPPGAARASAASAASRVPPRVIRLPMGSARLGTDEPHFPEDAEGPARAWTLSRSLWADAFEVSNARFAAFVDATGFRSEAHEFGWSFVHELAVPAGVRDGISTMVQGAEWWLPVPNASWRFPEGLAGEDALVSRADHPAVHVSKRDGDAFCAWAAGRLPKESEWEYAARAGRADELYPWGDALTTNKTWRANTWQGAFPRNNSAADGFAWTAPVDALGPQNAWGFYNIIGNAWEWTSDRWCPPRGSRRTAPPDCRRRTPADDAKEAADPGEVNFVKKGGSFMCHKSYCFRYRSAARHFNSANSGALNLGFRCFYDALPAWAEEHVPTP